MSLVPPVCLDTRVVSWYLKGRSQALNFINKLQQEGALLYTTTVNVAEYFMGYYKAKTIPKEKGENIQTFFDGLDPRPLDFKAAQLAGELFAGPLKGQTIGWRDTFIAAICLRNGGRIATNNVDHFLRVPNLEVVRF